MKQEAILEDPKSTIVLRVVISDHENKVIKNNSYELARSISDNNEVFDSNWQTSLDKIAESIPGMTNQMKLALKRHHYFRVVEPLGNTVEFIVQALEPSGQSELSSSEEKPEGT